MDVVDHQTQENQEDNSTKDSDPVDETDKNTSKKDLLKPTQTDKRSVSPLSLLKEDFRDFKEGVFKVFRDKEAKEMDQGENKPVAVSTLALLKEDLTSLKEDLSQFKDDVSSVFSLGASKSAESTAEKHTNRLSVLKDDLASVFRLGVKEESVKPSRAEGSFRSLFRRDQKTIQKAEDSQTGLKEWMEEQTADCWNVDESTVDTMKEEDETVREEQTQNLSETQPSEEGIPATQADEQVNSEREEWSDDSSVTLEEEDTINEEEEEAKEDQSGSCVSSSEGETINNEEKEEKEKEEKEGEVENPSENLPWESLSSGIDLFSLTDTHRGHTRNQLEGEDWSVKNFACYLTFDPNTANSELLLTECNRKATRTWTDNHPSDHPDRFERCPQLLCREGLLDPVYWEVEWTGGVDIGVTYNSISRQGDTASSLLGHNAFSWSLECAEGFYTPCHDNKRFGSFEVKKLLKTTTKTPQNAPDEPYPFSNRVGVYLDWSGGTLAFYCVCGGAIVHIHSFSHCFSQPLYPAFWVWTYEGSVALRQVELDWERLLQ